MKLNVLKAGLQRLLDDCDVSSKQSQTVIISQPGSDAHVELHGFHIYDASETDRAIADLRNMFKDSYGLRKQIQEAIADIEDVQRLVASERGVDLYHGDCFVLHASDATHLIADATYDIYGKLFVENGRKREAVTYDMYEKAVYNYDLYNYVPHSLLADVFGFIADLYEDNDQFDWHNADGTAKK